MSILEQINFTVTFHETLLQLLSEHIGPNGECEPHVQHYINQSLDTLHEWYTFLNWLNDK